jgi:hypothetical protein
MDQFGAFAKLQKVKISRFGVFEIFQGEGCSKFRTIKKKS